MPIASASRPLLIRLGGRCTEGAVDAQRCATSTFFAQQFISAVTRRFRIFNYRWLKEAYVQGILIEKDDAGYRANLTDIDEAQLPEGDVTVAVQYSTLNYQRTAAIHRQGPVVRKFPDGARHRSGGDGRAQQQSRIQGRRRRSAQRLGRGRRPLGAGVRRRGLAGRLAGPLPAGFTPSRRWPSAPPAIPRCCA